MSIVNSSQATAFGSRYPSRIPILCGISAFEILVLLLPLKWWGVCALLLAGVIALGVWSTAIVHGRMAIILVGWVLIYPLGYYYCSFPREQALFTLDRFFIITLLASILFASGPICRTLSPMLRNSAVCWAVFLLFAGLAALRAKTPSSSLRIWLEAFLFPAVIAWAVIRYFEARRFLGALQVVTCLMAMYVATIGVVEAITFQDLLPLPGGGFIVAGDSTDATAQLFPRPNGPFSTNSSFAMIGLVSFLFLVFARKALGTQMHGWRLILHRLGSSAALCEALLPLFRSIMVSLAVVVLIDAFYQVGWRRTVRLSLIGCLGLSFLSLRLLLPSVFEERSGSATLYARIAQQKQTVQLFLDHPMNGIGLSNFTDALQNTKYSTFYEDEEALDSAHNNLGAVLAETGLTGFLPFVASQIFIMAAFWKLRSAESSEAKLASKMFLFLFMCYWINGMFLTTAYFADLNLWYMLVVSVLYKFALPSGRITIATSQETVLNYGQ